MLDDPFEYQNGAQWDWFGGKLVYALFQNGYSRAATQKLQEIIRKNIANRGFFEWDNREGVGLGSDSFCGSAGSLARAVIEGYYGVRLGVGRVSLEPRLGADSGRIHIYQPGNDGFLAYDYRYRPADKRITLRVNSNMDLPVYIKLPAPESIPAEELTLSLNGNDMDFQVMTRNGDLYLELKTPVKPDMAELTLRW
jgi:hypothetical protein